MWGAPGGARLVRDGPPRGNGGFARRARGGPIFRAGHLIPGHILVQVTEQVSDEARHFDILRALVPEELHQVIEEKVAALPAVLVADPHWAGLLAALDAGNPFAALLDVNIVHEGYS